MSRAVDPPPPGWAVRQEDRRVEYVLCLFAPSAEEAERMARDEADRFVVEFAEEIGAWLDSESWHRSEAVQEWEKYAEAWRIAHGEGEDRSHDFQPFYAWLAEQIIKMAKRERPIP